MTIFLAIIASISLLDLITESSEDKKNQGKLAAICCTAILAIVLLTFFKINS